MILRKIPALFVSIIAFASCSPLKESIKPSTEAPLPLSIIAATEKTLVVPTAAFSDELGMVFAISSNKDICFQEVNSEIWIANYQEKPRKLLGSDDLDFYLPEFSPDGQWFAYVQSEPDYISELSELNNSIGVDAVWMMKTDGTGNKKIGLDITSAILSWSNGCQVVSSIEKSVVWSPDGRYIAFINTHTQDGFVYDYYVIDVITAETIFLASQDRGSLPVWSLDSQHIAIVSGRNTINVFDVSTEPSFKMRALDLPENITANLFWDFLEHSPGQSDLYTVAGVFYEGVADSNNPKYLSYWQLNLATGDWLLLSELNHETKQYMLLADKDNIYACDRNSGKVIKILNPLNISSESTIDLEDNIEINCRSLRSLPEKQALFFETPNLDSIQMLIFPNDNVETLIDVSELNLQHSVYIYYFSITSIKK